MGALDGRRLGWLARGFWFYQRELGVLVPDSVRVAPAALYYLLYPAAIVYLALLPSSSLGEAARRSALLGLTAFGVCDLTNLATLRGDSLALTVVDMAWGGFASALGGAAAHRFALARAAGISAPR